MKILGTLFCVIFYCSQPVFACELSYEEMAKGYVKKTYPNEKIFAASQFLTVNPQNPADIVFQFIRVTGESEPQLIKIGFDTNTCDSTPVIDSKERLTEI